MTLFEKYSGNIIDQKYHDIRSVFLIFPNMNDESVMALVYFNFRGMAQPVRSLLAYLELPYYNVHLDEFSSQK